MKLLLMDGIPKGHAYEAYSDDIKNAILADTQHDIDYFRLRDMNIHHCTGCWSCWYKTPGRCAIKDDYEQLLSRIPHADALVYITPVIIGYESALLKTCKDRSIPTIHPYVTIHEGEQHHYKRYESMHYTANVLLLSDEDTTDGDIDLIRHAYDRIALNAQTHVNLFHVSQGEGGIDYVLNNI